MEMQRETAVISNTALYSSLEVPFCQREEGAGRTASCLAILYDLLVSQSQGSSSQAPGEETEPGVRVGKPRASRTESWPPFPSSQNASGVLGQLRQAPTR